MQLYKRYDKQQYSLCLKFVDTIYPFCGIRSADNLKLLLTSEKIQYKNISEINEGEHNAQNNLCTKYDVPGGILY